MNSHKVVVIDYGLGNLFSVKRALEKCGATDVLISSSPYDIDTASRVILPGVGSFNNGIKELRSRDLIDPIQKYVASGRPFLGICLGMQLLASEGEEFGRHEGLSLIPGIVRRIPELGCDGTKLKIPSIGWKPLKLFSKAICSGTVLDGIKPDSFFYFVHSFQFEAENADSVLAYYHYGGHKITAAVRQGFLYGCQFHPEKSGVAGLRLLSTFLNPIRALGEL